MELTACSAGIDSSKNRVPAVAAEGGLCQSPGSRPDTRQVPGLWVCDLHTEVKGLAASVQVKRCNLARRGHFSNPAASEFMFQVSFSD